ncbi:MAG TPA: DNA polymerase III subunit gamma/tau [bacterium]|nr:DNA polymerase III subunit gamma/tau [bacterium]
MSYLVLARKWRPQAWDDVVAQEHVTATLRNAVRNQRLAHAYLFTGPRGVGKTSAARILAKTLNCEQGKETPCNQCGSCEEITSGRHVDVFEIDGASNRGIDEVRSLRENIRYTPARGRRKVYIIDEVHMLTPPAFNALLKTLEEPPDHVIFVFATTEPHKVPATILSRCQRFDFRRISARDIIEHLQRICREESIEIEDEALHLIAMKADGSLRDSQSILDQMIAFTESRITADHVVQGLGLIEQEWFFKVTDILASKDLGSGMELVEKVVTGGYDPEEFISGLMEHFRNLLAVRAAGKADLVDGTEDLRKRTGEAAGQFAEEDLIRLIEILNRARVSVKNAVNPRIPMEMAMVKMIRMDRTVTVEDLLQRLDKLGSGNFQAPVDAPLHEQNASSAADSQPSAAEPVRDPEPPEKKKKLSLDEVNENWDALIQQIKHRKITIGSFLQEGRLLGVEDNVIQIGFGLQNGFHMDAIKRSEAIVLDVLRNQFGSAVRFQCIKKDFGDSRPVSPQEEKESLLEKLKSENPAVGRIIDDLDAEIIQ